MSFWKYRRDKLSPMLWLFVKAKGAHLFCSIFINSYQIIYSL